MHFVQHSSEVSALAKARNLPLPVLRTKQYANGFIDTACLFPLGKQVNIEELLLQVTVGRRERWLCSPKLLGKFQYLVNCVKIEQFCAIFNILHLVLRKRTRHFIDLRPLGFAPCRAVSKARSIYMYFSDLLDGQILTPALCTITNQCLYSYIASNIF